jgi:hypothetical protein
MHSLLYVLSFTFTKESTEPPENVHVSDINPNQLTIEWSPPRNSCPVVTYNIAVTDCGIVCPNATTKTSIKCTNLIVNGQACSVVIQTIACESSSEHSGDANLTIVLKGNNCNGNESGIIASLPMQGLSIIA